MADYRLPGFETRVYYSIHAIERMKQRGIEYPHRVAIRELDRFEKKTLRHLNRPGSVMKIHKRNIYIFRIAKTRYHLVTAFRMSQGNIYFYKKIKKRHEKKEQARREKR